jgi:hypothetical protein
MNSELELALQTGRDLLDLMDEAGYPKPESPTKTVSRLYRRAGIYPEPHFVVAYCDQEFFKAAEKAKNEGRSEAVIRKVGRLAYCNALPKLSGATNIRNFIACVTHAMALEILPGSEGTRLLYAAQVAQTALTKRPKKRNKSSHTGPRPKEATIAESTE